MSGEHVSNDVTLGDGVPANDENIVAIAFEVAVSVIGAIFYDVGLQLRAFVCVVLFQRPAELEANHIGTHACWQSTLTLSV